MFDVTTQPGALVVVGFCVDHGAPEIDRVVTGLRGCQLVVNSTPWVVEAVVATRSHDQGAETDSAASQQLAEVLHRLRSQLHRKGCRVRSSLAELDPRRKGRVPIHRVQSVLSASLGVQLSAADFATIQTSYPCHNEAWEAPSTDVDWVRFAADVDAAFEPSLPQQPQRVFVPCPNRWSSTAGEQHDLAAVTQSQGTAAYPSPALIPDL